MGGRFPFFPKINQVLSQGGLVALFFPSGVVASSDTIFGPVIEREWNAFTAKMIRKSGATVVPVFFSGLSSRAYQIANQLSPTLRHGFSCMKSFML